LVPVMNLPSVRGDAARSRSVSGREPAVKLYSSGTLAVVTTVPLGRVALVKVFLPYSMSMARSE